MIETAEQRAKRIKGEEKERTDRAASYAAKQAEQNASTSAVIPVDPNAALTVLGAKTLTKQIRDHLAGAETLILRAYDLEAWKMLKYDSWEAYVLKEFSVSKSRAYQLIKFAKTVDVLKGEEKSTNCRLPEGEGQTRPLNKLPDGQKKEAWERATKKAKGQPTASQVKDEVDRMKPAKAREVPAKPNDPLAESTPPDATKSNGDLPPAASIAKPTLFYDEVNKTLIVHLDRAQIDELMLATSSPEHHGTLLAELRGIYTDHLHAHGPIEIRILPRKYDGEPV